MKIIVFLGNPEKKYFKTRHNIGFIIGHRFINNIGLNLNKKSFSSVCGTGKFNNNDILAMFPQTYMNSSGTAVMQALNYYKEDPSNLVVIHDEIELPFGEFNSRFGGGHRGHNGLRSIVDKIGTRDFQRIRFGVDRPDNPNISVADYVLSNFKKEEFDKIEELIPEIIELINSFINESKVLN